MNVRTSLLVLTGLLLLGATAAHAQWVDTDGDGIPDALDNCVNVSNANQLDSDGDGYGNACDADLNNSGTVTATDFGLMKSVLNKASTFSPLAAAADLNGSGTVTATDFGLLKSYLNKVPGPSGLQPNCPPTCGTVDAALNGNYTFVSYALASATNNEGTTVLDGSGNYTSSYTTSVNGVIATNQTAVGAYSLTNSSLSVSRPPPNAPFLGALSGGSHNIWIGTTLGAGNNPVVIAAVKQGSGMTLGSLAGTYIGGGLAVYAGSAVVDAGTFTVNANGSGSLSGTQNLNGVISPETPAFPAGSITLSSSGTVSLPGPGTNARIGGVSPDYDLVITADELAADGPYVLAAVRAGSGSSTATLNGQYTVMSFSGGLTGGYTATEGKLINIVMDGLGHYISFGNDNLQGGITLDSSSGTYSVTANGVVTINTSDGNTLNGGVSADGTALVLYQITAGHAPELFIGIHR